jgi:hypothetical protein
MVRPRQDRLSSRIEAGESYPGRQGERICGPQTTEKAIVAVAIELNHGRVSRAGPRCVPDLSPSSLTDLLAEAVLPESPVNTDGWYTYEGLANRSAQDRLTTTSRVVSSPREPGPAVVVER